MSQEDLRAFTDQLATEMGPVTAEELNAVRHEWRRRIGGDPTLPPGTTLYHCPLCDWTHALPPVTVIDIRPGLTPEDIVGVRITAVEGELRVHLETHSLVEWVTKAAGQQQELDLLRAEVAKLSAEKERAERDAVLTAACLVRKLGGSVTITDADMVAEDGTLARIPEVHGFTLALHP